MPDIKHRQTPSKVNINSHTKCLFTSVPITWYNISSIQHKFKGMPKGKGKQSKETKQASEPDLYMAQMLEWLEEKFKISMINIVMGLVGEIWQYERMNAGG